MFKKIDYVTEDERLNIIGEQEGLGLRLLEDQIHFDGNHLIFTDGNEKGYPVRNLEVKVDDLEERVEKLEPSTPPLCTHWAIIDTINIAEEKPVRVKRTWEGKEYSVNCYVTEGVKDQYLAGNLAIGDYVLVEFLEDRADRAVVFAKVLVGN